MGFVVLHINKASGNDAAMTAHIERTIDPKNADRELTYLNRQLISYPTGIKDRTQAITHRIETSGITRKVGINQVRALRVMLSGSPEDMHRIVAEGRLDEWCADNVKWLRDTFGVDNVVSADLHRDETTPHIHATIVPIVSGERRKIREQKKRESEPGRDENQNPSEDKTPGKLDGDHAGHLFGDRFGGSPELDNLVSQARSVNLSEFKKIENKWADAINGKPPPPKKVTVDIKVDYVGDAARPTRFNVRYTIYGKKYSQTIKQ